MQNQSMKKANLRSMVRGVYDIQKLRIMSGNRIVANWKNRHGQEPSKPEAAMTAEGKRILDDIRREYKRITDGLTGLPKKKNFAGTELISDYVELCLIDHYEQLLSSENRHFLHIQHILEDFPIYSQWLIDVRGVGKAMSGVIISEIDIAKAKYPSSINRYAGLDIAEDFKGRSRRAEHLVEYKYINKDGEEATRKGITFNPFLKTKLVGVLADCFIKLGGNPYREVYDRYRQETLEADPRYAEHTKGHKHNMAKRKMIKAFLRDLYYVWRPLEGLQCYEPYQLTAARGMLHQSISFTPAFPGPGLRPNVVNPALPEPPAEWWNFRPQS